MRGKVVVITGASSGIGEALAVHLGRMGAKLVLAARRETKLQALAEQFADTLVVPTDVTDESACENLIERAVEKFGRIDVLVNNAGISMTALFEDITDLSMFHKIMDVNYFGSVNCTYYALPYLKQSQGLVVAVSSMTGKTGVPTRSAYAASKHAMQGFFDSLRIELMDTGVDVLVVSPGYVQSEVRYNALGADGTPRGESHLSNEAEVMTAEECAAIMVNAMQQRKRDVIIGSLRSRLLPVIKLLIPERVDKIARQAITSGKT